MKMGHRIAIGVGTAVLVGLVLPRLFWFKRARAPKSARLGALRLRHGTDLAYFHLRSGHAQLVIVAHGFLKSKNLPAVVRVCETLAQDADALAFDFSGHGESTGEARLDYSRAARELISVIDHARALGYEQIGVVGYSMGAAAAILAAAQGAPIQALVCVSTPVRPRAKAASIAQGTGTARSTRSWRWWARLMGTRVAAAQGTSEWPIQHIAGMPRIPLLLVHDGLDALIRRQDPDALFSLANMPKRRLCVPAVGHISPDVSVAAICAFIAANLGGATATLSSSDELSAALSSSGKELQT